MAEIISDGRRVHVEAYEYYFASKTIPGAGLGFDCDKDGNIFLDRLQPAALANLEIGQAGVEYTDMGVRDVSYNYYQPAVIRCSCGRELPLSDCMTNSCECGLEYNGGGQLLAPRSQWGDEFTNPSDADLYGPDPEAIFPEDGIDMNRTFSGLGADGRPWHES